MIISELNNKLAHYCTQGPIGRSGLSGPPGDIGDTGPVGPEGPKVCKKY